MTKIWMLCVIVFFSSLLIGLEQPMFEDYFLNKTMRIDCYHTGDSGQEFISLDQIYIQGMWSGNPRQLVDTMDNGRYYIKVQDLKSGTMIFSKGYDSYFGEYKTTEPAQKGIKRTYHESALIPCPKSKIRFSIEIRDSRNQLQPLFTQEINPKSIEINREILTGGVKVFETIKNGDPHKKVDLAFIAEGYTLKEEEKFKKDLQKLTQLFFQQEPYQSTRKKFNVYGVFKPSQQSGGDEPRRNIYKNTSIGTTFNSLGLERYLLTENNRSLRDIAAHVPYDCLIIVVNHSRYGGGGIYNSYSTLTVDNQWHPYLLLHEFGHSFAGLADEYYTSAIAYNEFYPKGIEPLEPNITALLNPDNLKWNTLATKGIEIPTPWEKEEFDRMAREYQKIREKINRKITRMSTHGTSKTKLESLKNEADKLSKENALKVDAFLEKSKFRGMVGAFMGAGYSSQGLFRPMVECIMFTIGQKPYCNVCKAAILKTIERYSSE